MRILAGDIGGTKTELVVFEDAPATGRAPGAFGEVERVRVASAEHGGLEEIAAPLLASGAVDAAAFGVAGPVHAGRCKTTNLPWQLDERELGSALGCQVRLLNDFSAVVHGIGELDDAQLQVLQEGERDPAGPFAVIGAGTGLGEGIGVRGGHGRVIALAGEGGHRDLAPRNATEDRLLAYLRRRLGGRVSVERVVSGMGLPVLHDFVIDDGLAVSSAEVLEEIGAGDAAAVIGQHGQAGDDDACSRALDLFIGLYGAAAGNLALGVVPSGGLYVAGGIAPRLVERIARGDFMEALLDKGRMGPLLARVPVAVVLEPRVGLLGARACAARLALP